MMNQLTEIFLTTKYFLSNIPLPHHLKKHPSINIVFQKLNMQALQYMTEKKQMNINLLFPLDVFTSQFSLKINNLFRNFVNNLRQYLGQFLYFSCPKQENIGIFFCKDTNLTSLALLFWMARSISFVFFLRLGDNLRQWILPVVSPTTRIGSWVLNAILFSPPSPEVITFWKWDSQM